MELVYNFLQRRVVVPLLVGDTLNVRLSYFHSKSPFRQAYAKPNTRTTRKKPMLSNAIAPKSFTTTAHGYRNTVSTSNMRNKMAKR